jgi:hypothetical protein
MQTLGMFYADEIFYLFESASRLMIIPRLPVNIDDAAFAEIEEHFDNYRKMSIGIPLPGDSIKAISASMILRAEDDGDCVLSPWGTILWDKFIEKHYEKEIYSPPIPEIILKNSFFSDTSRFKQDGGRLSHINQRIDDLAKFLLLKTKLKRLSFGKIEDDLGKKTGCTHEFYAWGDGAAYRFYGRYRADKFEVIHLLKHTKR